MIHMSYFFINNFPIYNFILNSKFNGRAIFQIPSISRRLKKEKETKQKTYSVYILVPRYNRTNENTIRSWKIYLEWFSKNIHARSFKLISTAHRARYYFRTFPVSKTYYAVKPDIRNHVRKMFGGFSSLRKSWTTSLSKLYWTPNYLVVQGFT